MDEEQEPADFDTPEAESGELPEDDGKEEAEADDPDAEFVCIFCCKDEEEKQMVAEMIGETEELRRHYTVAEIRRRLEENGSEYLDDDSVGYPKIFSGAE